MTKKTKNNPLGLRIGQRITISKKAYVEYSSDGIRTINTQKLYEPLVCYVLSCVLRAEGQYHKGCLASFEQDYDPAYLKVTKYVRLYQCAVSLNNKPFLVIPEDVILI